jgi:O-antigen/teichoic acid export membrane protein
LLSCSQVLLPLISIPYISKVLHPEGVGRVSFIDSLSYCFVAIAEFGIVAYGIREIAKVRSDKNLLRKLVSELLVLHCITSAFTLMFYGITVLVLWSEIQDMRLVYFSGLFLLINAFACEWYFWALERFGYITLRSFISRVSAVIALLLLVKAPEDYYIYYCIIAIAAILNLLANFIIVFRELGFGVKNIQWKRHIKQTMPTYLISLVYSIMLWFDNVLLSIVSTTAVVGIYALSMKMIRICTNLFTDMFLVLYPRTANLLHQDQNKALQQTISHSVQFIFIITIPASAGLFLLSEPLVKALLGVQFYEVMANLRILAVLPLVKTYSLFLNKQILMSHGKDKLTLFSLVTGSMAYIVLMLVLSYMYHARGACYAMVLAELIILGINYRFVRKHFPEMKIFDSASLFQSLLASLLFVPVIWLLNMYVTSPVVVVLLSVIVCILLYFLLQWQVMKNKLVNTLIGSAMASLKKNNANIQ